MSGEKRNNPWNCSPAPQALRPPTSRLGEFKAGVQPWEIIWRRERLHLWEPFSLKYPGRSKAAAFGVWAQLNSQSRKSIADGGAAFGKEVELPLGMPISHI